MIIFDQKELKKLARDYGRTDAFQIDIKFGFNEQVSNATYEDIWVNGGTLSLLSSAETMNIVSTSVEDNSGGTGATQIKIEGLDNNYNRIEEIVTLNGTTIVPTTRTFLRINRMYIVGTVGSNQTNVGVITATSSSSATVQANIGANFGQTQKTQFTVPSGFTMFIFQIQFDCGKGDDFDTIIETKEFGTGWAIKNRFYLFQQISNIETMIVIPQKADIRIKAKGGVSNNKPISASYTFALLKNNS